MRDERQLDRGVGQTMFENVGESVAKLIQGSEPNFRNNDFTVEHTGVTVRQKAETYVMYDKKAFA